MAMGTMNGMLTLKLRKKQVHDANSRCPRTPMRNRAACNRADILPRSLRLRVRIQYRLRR